MTSNVWNPSQLFVATMTMLFESQLLSQKVNDSVKNDLFQLHTTQEY